RRTRGRPYRSFPRSVHKKSTRRDIVGMAYSSRLSSVRCPTRKRPVILLALSLLWQACAGSGERTTESAPVSAPDGGVSSPDDAGAACPESNPYCDEAP